ncbi:MAG: hypothetical protein ACOC9B_03720 [Chloroflexota bacterium]
MEKNRYIDALDRLSEDQNRREGKLLADLLGESNFDDLAAYEANLANQQSKLLFSIQAEIEDSEIALKQTEELAKKLKKHVERLKGLQKVLSK